MSLASDLMGIGVSPLLAARTATAGTGPISVASVGTTFATATKIGCTQFLISNTANGSVALPSVGGDNGAFIGDDFVINNAAGSLNVFLSSGVSISVGGSNQSNTTLASHITMACYPVSTTQWIAVKGS